MRARRRRNASDYFSAALLELSIMGIFVVIAQPQLRQGLIELIDPSSAEQMGGLLGRQLPNITDSTSPASPNQIGQLSASSSWLETPSLVGAQLMGAQMKTPERAGWSMKTANYSPVDQFESFTVSSSNAPSNVPVNVSSSVSASPSSYYADTTPSLQLAQSRVPHQFGRQYAPTAGATQLNSSDWNIAAATQSPRPLTGWTSARPADAAYRDTYPPPFGTQSQWK